MKQWRKAITSIITLCLIGFLPIFLGADAPAPPPRVETSIGIYDVQSKDDLLKFSAEQIRELVRMEDDRIRGAAKPPHPILVYCFEERSFQYTGGQYDNAEIKYRLRVPQKVVYGKKYPLVVHLHGVGESGRDNMRSLTHLHSILPLMVGPEQQDFYLLVLQCQPDNRAWTFKPETDGNLDVVIAATDHVIKNNPIDVTRLSVFGLSSGGYGVWEWIKKDPGRFVAAVPTACGAPNLKTAINTAIWTFCNRGDGNISIESIHKSMRVINDSGGFMKLTQFDQGGHAAWQPAMDEYNCFAWMIAQKRGGWFNPPPEREVYQGRSLTNSFFAFFLPLGLAAGLFVFQRSRYCELLYERMHGRVVEILTPYRSRDAKESDNAEKIADIDSDGFRMWSGITGTKQFKAKVVGFQGDNQVRMQSPEGKVATVPIKQFCTADQELIRKMQAKEPPPGGFRRWAKHDGLQSVVAKFAGFQPDGKVLLQSPAGKTLAVPINQLGQAEQDFLAQQTASLPDGFREWTNFSETEKIVAKLLGFQDGKARFELENGQRFAAPINQFSAEDQALLTQLMSTEKTTT